MELRPPPRTAATIVQPLAETTEGISDSHDALAKGDRLEVTYAKSEAPTPPGPVDEPISPPEAATIGSPPEAATIGSPQEAATVAAPEAPRIINRHRPITRKVTTAVLPRSKPKTIDIKRVAIRDRPKAASDPEPCRLSAFGGLRKALNSSDCEI
jgi:hypothetical protein